MKMEKLLGFSILGLLMAGYLLVSCLGEILMHICPLHSYFKQSLNDQVEAWLAQGNEIKKLAHGESGHALVFQQSANQCSINFA